jgi:hypothetical protein
MWSDGINGFTFHNVWTGTYGATVAIYASNDPRAREGHPDNANAEWVNITSLLTITDPVTGGGNDMIIINNSRFAFIKLDLGSSSGTGTCTTWVCSHGTG